jgi:hypothetical protein
VALPPFALPCWFWFTLPPVADELLLEVALDSAFELPDVALPPVLEPDPLLPPSELLEFAFALPVVPLAPPEEAPELLLLFAFPLPETL